MVRRKASASRYGNSAHRLGAGFIVALTGKVLTMPGLPKKPAALNMDIDENGHISGLF